MQALQAGIIVLLFPVLAFAQVIGEVDSIGFKNLYRADCWTPLSIRLKPTTSQAGTYQVRVQQTDMDGDTVEYVRTISVTGLVEGAPTTRDQQFLTYFIPKSTRQSGFEFGLPQPADGLAALQNQLRVTITLPNGDHVTTLAITQTAGAVDPYINPRTDSPPKSRGTRMVLAVGHAADNGTYPVGTVYDGALGLLENTRFIDVTPADLPDNVIGYEGVDAVMLLNVDPNDLRYPSPQRLDALRQFVREGGRLVITQPVQWERTLALGDLLPVTFPRTGPTIGGMVDRASPEPLRTLARSDTFTGDPWFQHIEPYKVAIAVPKKEAIVVQTMAWNDASLPTETPWLVRMPYGLGSVTWVAQDLTDRTVTRIGQGWSFVWNSVLDFPDQIVFPPPRENNAMPSDEEVAFGQAAGIDIGNVLLPHMDHGQRSMSLMLIAAVFFVIYWLIAGPVSYLVLSQQRRRQLSWFAFAIVALAATVLTAGVVQLVLRGQPEGRHLSVIRQQPNGSVTVTSRVGIYVPRDGEQVIDLGEASPDTVNYVIPYPQHPQHQQGDRRFIDTLSYHVDVPVDGAEDDRLTIPFRATLKKIMAKWHGELHAGIYGRAVLKGTGLNDLETQLTNNTGYNLTDVYFVYLGTTAGGTPIDYARYIPTWNNGALIDLSKDFEWHVLGNEGNLAAMPGQGKAIVDMIASPTGREIGWTRWYWYLPLQQSRQQNFWDLIGTTDYERLYPMLCVFDRLPPMRNTDTGQRSRSELHRRGARHLDLSPAISAGQLAIFGRADGPVPSPLTVNGQTIAGNGAIIYQAAVPLERPVAPATQPATTQSAP